MFFSDSMFLFEIVVEELKSYIYCKAFSIRSQFAGVFKLNLIDPNTLDPLKPKKQTKLIKNEIKGNNRKPPAETLPAERKLPNNQSILITSPISKLITAMKNFPLQLSLYNKQTPLIKLGSAHVPWSPTYIDYLNKLHENPDAPPTHVSCGYYNVYTELNCKPMALIRLNIKLTHLIDKLTPFFPSLYKENQNILMTSINTIKKPSKLIQETCVTNTLSKYETRKNTTSFPCKSIANKATETVTTEKKPSESPVNKRKYLSYFTTDTLPETKKPITNLSMNQSRLNIYGNNPSPISKNLDYCVNYFTLENPSKKDADTTNENPIQRQKLDSKFGQGKHKFRICDKNCPTRRSDCFICAESVCSLDIDTEIRESISVMKCKQIRCDNRQHLNIESPPDAGIVLDISSLNKDCCNINEAAKKKIMKAKTEINHDEKTCLCSCKCESGFGSHESYCKICGGYKPIGDEYTAKFVCPELQTSNDNLKTSSESEISKTITPIKPKKLKCSEDKDERFNFNYGFTGIPAKIGHNLCLLPCTGTVGRVPTKMGWLWTAENTSSWRPGAITKNLLRLLNKAKSSEVEVVKKKKKKEVVPKETYPLLTVAKKDGEFNITMERMKTYLTQRALDQYPYEDKPVLTYTIGRTEEENRERQKKKEREKRRLEKDKRAFIQSAFSDMCKDICLRTYQQAIGVLPNAQDNACACYPKHPEEKDTNFDNSCTCSENDTLFDSSTDSNEWIMEYTPPNALFDARCKVDKPQEEDKACQYTYLDYSVKLLDRFGKPVARFFKDLDGKLQCSDLGGFWSKDKKWLKINQDGYIAPDGRWAPKVFKGPNGEQVVCNNNGHFRTADKQWLQVGIDGYVDSNNTWKFYPRTKGKVLPSYVNESKKKESGGRNDNTKCAFVQTTCNSFVCTKPKDFLKTGMSNQGYDKKLLGKTTKQESSHNKYVNASGKKESEYRKDDKKSSFGPCEITCNRVICTKSEFLKIGFTNHGHDNKLLGKTSKQETNNNKYVSASRKKEAKYRMDDKKKSFVPYETTCNRFVESKPKDFLKIGTLGHRHDKKLLVTTSKQENHNKYENASRNKEAADRKDNKKSSFVATTWNSFGNTNSTNLLKKGILSHEYDKKLLETTLKQEINHHEFVNASRRNVTGEKNEDKKSKFVPYEGTWNCFGDANPKELLNMGILGHGHDKKVLEKTLKQMIDHGEDVRIQPRIASQRGAKCRGT